MSSTSVSVVIPTYNRASLVARAIDSVLRALSPGDEIIVVDDGSTDGTERVLASYGDRIRAVRTPNGGVGKARNRGVQEARHPRLAFLDSDDEWMPDCLLLGRRFLEARSDVIFCFSDFGLRHARRPDEHHGLAGWHNDPRPWDEILGPGIRYSEIASLPPGREDFRVHVGSLYSRQLDAPYIPVQTLLVRRDQAESALRFPEDLRTYADWECLARLARAGPAAYLDCETAWQWGHDAPRLTDAGGLDLTSERITIVERVWAADRDFLTREAEHVRDVLGKLRVLRARLLIHHGRNAEARADLRLAGGGPASVRALAALPGFLTRGLFSARAAARRAFLWRPRDPIAPATSAGRSPTGVFTFETFHGLEGLADLRDEWELLVGRLPDPGFMQFYPWHEGYMLAFELEPGSVRFLVASSAGTPVGIFALKSSSRWLAGVPVRTLEIPTHPHSQLCDFVFPPGAERAAVLAALVEHLHGLDDVPWEVLVMPGLLETSAAWSALRASAAPRTVFDEVRECHYVHCRDFEDRLGMKARGQLRKKRERLASLGTLSLDVTERPDDVARATVDFIAVEGSGWKGSAGSAIRCNPRLVDFYQSVAAGFAARGAAQITLLRLDGRCIAGQYALRGGRSLYVLKIGYDEKYATMSPGEVLRDWSLHENAARGAIDEVNFGTPTAGRWHPESYAVFEAMTFRRSLRGQAAYLAVRAKRALRPTYHRWADRWARLRRRAGSPPDNPASTE